jgi:hypothetical protein
MITRGAHQGQSQPACSTSPETMSHRPGPSVPVRIAGPRPGGRLADREISCR